MNDETDHNTAHNAGHASASRSSSSHHPLTHRQSLRRGKVLSGAQNEGLVFGATDAISSHHAASQETQSPLFEPHPAPTRSVVSQDIEETVYSDDTKKITEKIIDPVSGEITTFEAALKARYERLSLLTLDLAEDAGESARCFSTIEPRRMTQGIASMTKAIWAHRVIEKLRTGKALSTEDLAGLLPDVPNSPVKGPLTPSSDVDLNWVRHVAQGEGLGCGATNEIPAEGAIYAETPAPHSEPHPGLSRAAGSACASKDIGQVACAESTETKKEKTETKKRTRASNARETHPTDEFDQLAAQMRDIFNTLVVGALVEKEELALIDALYWGAGLEGGQHDDQKRTNLCAEKQVSCAPQIVQTDSSSAPASQAWGIRVSQSATNRQASAVETGADEPDRTPLWQATSPLQPPPFQKNREIFLSHCMPVMPDRTGTARAPARSPPRAG